MDRNSTTTKILMIAINLVVWGLALYYLLPIILGEDEAHAESGESEAAAARPAVGATRPSATRDERSERGETRHDPIVFFSRAIDPFRPILVASDGQADSPRLAVDRSRDNRQPYRRPGETGRERPPVTVSYRLTSIVRFNDKLVALMTTGSGPDSETLTVSQGQILASGEFVKEISFEKKYVILAKQGYLFKLTDAPPWLQMINRP